MEKTYLAPSTRPTCRPSPAPLQRAACRPGRQAGARRRPQRAPRTCSPPRCSPRPVTSWTGLPRSPEPPRHPLSSPAPPPRAPPPWPTPPSPCLRRSRAPRHPCVLSSCPGAPPLSTPSSKPSPERSQRPSPPQRPRPNRRRRRSPSTPSSLRSISGHTKGFVALTVSLAIFPSLPFLLPSRVATSRSSTAPTAVELVADVLPVTLRPLHGVHHAHRVT